MLVIRVCQLYILQVVAGVWQPLQKGWHALEAQPRQAATVRDQRPSLVSRQHYRAGCQHLGTVCDTWINVSCHHANTESDKAPLCMH